MAKIAGDKMNRAAKVSPVDGTTFQGGGAVAEAELMDGAGAIEAAVLSSSLGDGTVVDAARIEQQIDERMIGDRIRNLRLRRSMGLVELGRLTGLSASFLSQLETGRVVPTIRNLARIAIVFEKDLSYFFKLDKKVTFRRLSKSDRIPITKKQKQNARFVSQSLSSLIPDRHLVPCLAEFVPAGEESEFTPMVFRGTEFVYVLEGNLEIAASGQRQFLETGDVVWIDASTPRQYVCHGESMARALIVTQHPK